MGSIKQEKKIKKTKKRSRESKLNEGDATEADMKPCKSKKARKIRSKDDSSSSVPSVAANDADNSYKEEKRKSKNVLEDKGEHSTKKKAKSEKKVQKVKMPDAHKSKKLVTNKSEKDFTSCVPNITVSGANGSCEEKRKSKKVRKEKDVHSTNKKIKSELQVQEVSASDVYQISSVDEDDSKGMKKWIKEYHERRPGLKVLQDRIDEFITAHEEQEEQQKREREAQLSEEGWTVVVHRKGGKRTTDPESGVAVGSLAQAAILEKNAKKKNKDVGLDFYRFQRKEAHRSEVMKLQSKFEEDKKRIQQIRAARKFKPY